jgi:hypothetical protein
MINARQRDALSLMAQVVPVGSYLAGGVAVAARVQHRQSRDLDIFVGEGSPEHLAEPLSRLGDAVRILSRAEGTLYAEVLGIPVSVLRYAYPLLKPPEMFSGLALPLASLEDAMCMKLSAISNRGALRDFWDLHVLLEHASVSLDEALELYTKKYPVEDVGHVVRSLVYFSDADAEPPVAQLLPEQWSIIKRKFVERVNALT